MAASLPNQFTVHFWGVRGSIPCPGGKTIRYGGNTSCVEMRIHGQRLIFDGGTGLRVLGEEILTESEPLLTHLFFSHSHWDHVQGFPFFAPAYAPDYAFHIYGMIAPDGSTIEQRLGSQMLHPNFPIPIQIMASNLQFHDLVAGDKVTLGEIMVETGRLNHPGEAMGYRVNWGGCSVVYATDTEHFPDRLDENVVRLAWEADVLIYDSTYTDAEYHHPRMGKVGWGHSTWQEAVKVAQAARVKQLVVFHHDPSHSDEQLDAIALEVKTVLPTAVLAQEGMVLTLRSPNHGTMHPSHH